MKTGQKNGLSCPECTGMQVYRLNTHTDEEFFGCSEFPKCRWTANIDPLYSRRGDESIDEHFHDDWGWRD